MKSASGNAPRMRASVVGRLITAMYGILPLKRHFLSLAVRSEGGEMFSASAREILQRYHGVAVGAYSYGSLLIPGMADPGTRIGAYVSVGPNVRRLGAAHPKDSLTLHPLWYNPRLGFVKATEDVERSTCEIDHDAWIGANVVILPGCHRIGIGAIVGAGSIVTKDVPDFTIVAGNPARAIGERLTNDEREQLRDASPWTQGPAEMDQILKNIRVSRPG